MLDREAAVAISALLSAIVGILALFGVTEGTVVQTLTEMAGILGGGFAIRKKVYSKDTVRNLKDDIMGVRDTNRYR